MALSMGEKKEKRINSALFSLFIYGDKFSSLEIDTTAKHMISCAIGYSVPMYWRKLINLI